MEILWYLLPIITISLFLWQKPQRQSMLWAALLVLPVLSLKFAIVHNVFTTGFQNSAAVQDLVSQVLIGCSLGALGALVYENLLHTYFSPFTHPSRPRLILLIIGPVLGILIRILFDLPFITCIGIGLAVNLMITLIIERELIWDVLFSSLVMAITYEIAYLLAGPSLSGDVTDWWFVENLSGITLIGQPIEALTLVGVFGLLWGPLYVALKDYKDAVVPAADPNYISPKMTVGIMMIGLILLAYGWTVYQFVLVPEVAKAEPTHNAAEVGLTQSVTINFNKPIKTDKLNVVIEPTLPVDVHYEDKVFSRRLFKTLVIKPEGHFAPDTQYKVVIDNIQNVLGSTNQQYSFAFKTQEIPDVETTSVTEGQTGVAPCDPITVKLNQDYSQIAEFNFHFEPAMDVDIVQADKRTYSVTPKAPCFQQATTYKLIADRVVTVRSGDGEYVVSQSAPERVHEVNFTTKQPPRIASYSPNSQGVPISNNQFTLVFTESMLQEETLKNIRIVPAIGGTWKWLDNKTLRYDLSEHLKSDTAYTITVSKDSPDTNQGKLTEDVKLNFRTLGPAKVITSQPRDKSTGIGTNTSVSITFDQAVNQASAQAAFSMSSGIAGGFSWQGNTMRFTPSSELIKDTTYTWTLRSGIGSVAGADSIQEFKGSFTTEESVTMLNIALDYQDKALSCEVASLKMALAYKGISVSENELMSHVGYDPTTRSGGVWGDPDQAFVGDINGSQNTTGYGVHWAPIARAASHYRKAEAFSNWSIQDVAAKIAAGHPVVIWGVQGAARRDIWTTPGGRTINAYKGEHVRTLIGFRGSAENPRAFIINDPISGRITWTAAQFKADWGTFNNSGVVVY